MCKYAADTVHFHFCFEATHRTGLDSGWMSKIDWTSKWCSRCRNRAKASAGIHSSGSLFCGRIGSPVADEARPASHPLSNFPPQLVQACCANALPFIYHANGKSVMPTSLDIPSSHRGGRSNFILDHDSPRCRSGTRAALIPVLAPAKGVRPTERRCHDRRCSP